MSSTVTTTGFSQETFDRLLSCNDQPDWLVDLRRQAWDDYCRLPLPHRGQEEWMRTDIRLLRLDRYGLPAEPTSPPASLPDPLLATGIPLGGRVSAFDSRPQVAELDPQWARQGVLFGSLDQLVSEHGTLLRPFFERRIVRPDYDKFAALSAACWSGGTLLYVPEGVHVDTPLHTASILAAGGTDLGRTLVVLEAGASATLLGETLSTTADGDGLHCGAVELILGPSARLRYVNLQNWASGVWHFAHQKAILDRDARLQWTIGALGSRLAKVNQHVVLAGPGGAAQVNGVMFTEGRQHLCYDTLQHHQAPSCQSDLLYKAALQDRSRTVWRGMIRVDQNAAGTDGYQRNDNLLLSAKARADSIPGLEIETDDVRCTHASTSGRVDEEQVFYCRSRGMTRNEAIRMIVTGFFQQVFDRITIESVREALGHAIRRRIRDYE
jgi:Fe-S cluster assembly protein SufD